MNEPVATRIIEVCPGEWVVQFKGGLLGWTTFSDVFSTLAQAQLFEREQLDSADYSQE